ncbi:MAG: hypothetical protein AAFN91_04865 [Pseudomonadota bacterium]
MNDQTSSMTGALKEQDIVDLTKRPSDAFNEVILQADYTTRAALSFYRFRQLGGDYHPPRSKFRDMRPWYKRLFSAFFKQSENDQNEDKSKTPRSRKLSLDESTGRGVHYVSSHPKVPLLNLSVIALMIIFESAANAYFFAQASQFGLAGGIFQAAAVSIANVAVSFFIIGYWGLRHISMPFDTERPFSRRNLIVIMGLVAILVGLVLALLVNLSAAHYRVILDINASGYAFPEGIEAKLFPNFLANKEVCEAVLNSDLGNSIGSAATNAMCRPLTIHSLDGLVLFALGLSISAFAAFEGRRLDSPFPGFSDAARGLERARADLRDALYEFEESYVDIKAMILETKFGPADPEEPDDVYALKRKDGKDLSPREKVIVRKTMSEMVAPYIELLRTTDDALSDEFGLEHKIIDQFKAKTGQ